VDLGVAGLKGLRCERETGGIGWFALACGDWVGWIEGW